MFFQRLDGGRVRIVTSASDLTAASACEFAFLRRVDARLGREVDVPSHSDPLLRRAATLGGVHEARVLAQYVDQFGRNDGRGAGGVVEIAAVDPRNETDVTLAQNRTVSALRGAADVVFQATFFDPSLSSADADGDDIGFVGFADFLFRTDSGAYEVQDTKLARRAKVPALLQLAAYAEQLERLGVPVAPHAVLILGDGMHSKHLLTDVGPVFRARRERLHRLLRDRAGQVGDDGRRESAAPIAWLADDISVCGRCEVCEPEVERTRDPLLIAGIRRTQRDRLVQAGFGTIDAVAEARSAVEKNDLSVAGIAPSALERLAVQAAMQTSAREHATPGLPPLFHVADASALAAIPVPNPGDLFFDFEGDPLFRESTDDGSSRWGLDYLFGMVDTHEQFTAFWAHDLAAERAALQQFVEFVTARRRQYPAMRIYHYAAYERTHLLSIAARHGVCEAEIDQLLREHVLVDLYPIVRRALRVGARSYSMKKLEALYMGDELRDHSGVTDGAQSIVEYAEARTLLLSESAAERAEAHRRLEAIADYNRYDCVSTLRLRDWLLQLAAKHDVHSWPQPENSSAETGPDLHLSATAAALAQQASLAEDPQVRKAVALAGSAIDYYEREQKSFWWEHYARLVDPVEDWADTRDVLITDHDLSRLEHDWQAPQGRARLHRRRIRLRGEIAPGSNFAPDSDVFLLYAFPAPEPHPGAAPGSRGARRARIVERCADGVVVEETRRDEHHAWQELPMAVTPGPPPRAGAQKTAIEEWGLALATALERHEPFLDPVFDLLRRMPPTCTDGEPLTRFDSDEALAVGGSEHRRQIGATLSSLRRLGRSALSVQGPPGTGKTYLAAHVIRALVEEDGWHIGVVAQSHKVVENVLEAVVRAGLSPQQVGKVPQGGALDRRAPHPSFHVLAKDTQAAFVREHRASGRGSVIGGTAWDFANPMRAPRQSLDLLVIDEAGQFSLAPTIAASVAAQRMLLLGDPQQLPQVSQGTHPEPIDTSALGWVLDQHDTMPPRVGYFLSETRRMRPELTTVVSELAYEGRLHSHPSTKLRTVTGAGRAGLIWHPVRHHGNSTSSPEEAEVVVRIVLDAVREATLHEAPTSRKLSQRDVIVVAAYNAQVECLSDALVRAGLGEVRVGTVDRFQGQEAVISVVSLAASSSEDVPRGLEFLLMRNRLNVAISRAQWAAHLVSSDRLGASLPQNEAGVAALSAYLRLTELGRSARPLGEPSSLDETRLT